MSLRRTLPILLPVLYYCLEVAVGVRFSGGFPLPLWYFLGGLALAAAAGGAVLAGGRWLERVSVRVATLGTLGVAILVVVLKGLWRHPFGLVPTAAVLVVPLLAVAFLRGRSPSNGGDPTLWYTLTALLLVAGTGLWGKLARIIVEAPDGAILPVAGWVLLVAVTEVGSRGALPPPGSSRFHAALMVLTVASVGGAAAYWISTARPPAWSFENPYRGPDLVRPAKRAPDSPNVLVISLDTLRWDSVRRRGNHLENLARLRRKSVSFPNVFSPASWTLPAHASFFTGRLPVDHGAVIGAPTPIDGSLPTYTQHLRRLGYRTAAFTGGGPVHGDLGFARGFGRYEHQVVEPFGSFVPGALEYVAWCLRDTRYRFPLALLENRPRTSGGFFGLKNARGAARYPRYFSTSLRRARDWLEARRGEASPWFLFLHTFQIHDYYTFYPDAMRRLRRAHPRQWRALRRLQENPGRIPSLEGSDLAAQLKRRHERADPRMDAFYDRMKRWGKDLDRMNSFKRGQYRGLLASEAIHWKGLRNLYRYGLEAVDESLGDFLSFLRRTGRYDSTLIVVFSDHGEGFALDHGVVWHGRGQLDDELIRVPLWVKLPGENPRTGSDTATLQLQHVFPMVLEELNLPVPERSPLPDLPVTNPLHERGGRGITFPRGSTKTHLSEGPNFFVRGRGYKLIARHRGDSVFRAVRAETLPERSVEPGEIPRPIRRAMRERLGELERRSRRRRSYEPGSSGANPDLQRQLRGMGYQ